MICPKCGIENDDTQKQCQVCGSPLTPESKKINKKTGIIIGVVAVIIIVAIIGIASAIANSSKQKSVDDDWNSYSEDYTYTTEYTTIAETTTEKTTAKHKLSSNYTVLASGSEDNGDFYELVGEQNETVNNGGVKIGVIKNNEWLVEITSDIPFVGENGYISIIDAYSGKDSFNLKREYSNCGVFFEYCGNGIFIDYYLYAPPGTSDYDSFCYTYGVAYNSENGKSYKINCAANCALGLRYCSFDSSSMEYWNSDFKIRDRLVYKDKDHKFNILNLNTMETKQFDGIDDFSQYSNGLIFVRTEDKGFVGFIDEDFNFVIDLTDYNLKLPFKDVWGEECDWCNKCYFFKDGKCEINTRTDSGSVFKVTIDKTGKEINSVEIQ